MSYGLRLLIGTIRSLIWPDPTWARIAHQLVIFGTAALLGFSRLGEAKPMLRQIGMEWLAELPGWALIAGGVGLLAIALAVRVARLTTTRVVFGPLRLIPRDNEQDCDLPIRSVDHAPSPSRINMSISKMDGTLLGEYSLQTTGRLRSLETNPNFVGRILIDDAFKFVRLFSYNAPDEEFTFPHSGGAAVFSRNSFRLEIQVVGVGPRATRAITVTASAESIYISDGINGHGREIQDSG